MREEIRLPPRKQRRGLGNKLFVGEVLQGDGLAGAFRDAGASAVALGRVDDGVGVPAYFVDAVGAGAQRRSGRRRSGRSGRLLVPLSINATSYFMAFSGLNSCHSEGVCTIQ